MKYATTFLILRNFEIAAMKTARVTTLKRWEVLESV